MNLILIVSFLLLFLAGNAFQVTHIKKGQHTLTRKGGDLVRHCSGKRVKIEPLRYKGDRKYENEIDNFPDLLEEWNLEISSTVAGSVVGLLLLRPILHVGFTGSVIFLFFTHYLAGKKNLFGRILQTRFPFPLHLTLLFSTK